MFFKRLAAFTNVIPLIAKADTLSPEETELLKHSVIHHIRQAKVRSFDFNVDGDGAKPPFTVCSAPSNDDDTMDASLLMSPDYIQPLIPSELACLLDTICDKDNMSRLRHLAAKKLIQGQGSWSVGLPAAFPRSNATPKSQKLLTSSTSTVSPTHTSQQVVPYSNGISPYVQARIADHTQQEEKLAQIRLAKWAADLQRSLENERARYEVISRGERAHWLAKKLGECTNESALVPAQGRGLENSVETEPIFGNERFRPLGNLGLLDSGDPLGLLKWNEAMKRRGWIAFQVVGSFGILGAVAVWMARTWSSGSDGWAEDWAYGWFGGRSWA